MGLINNHLAQINILMDKTDETQKPTHQSKLTSENLNELNMMDTDLISAFSEINSKCLPSKSISKISNLSSNDGGVQTYAEKAFQKYKQKQYNDI